MASAAALAGGSGPLNRAIEPVLRLSPQFSVLGALRTRLGIYLFLVLWGTGFVGGAIQLVTSPRPGQLPGWPFLIVGLSLAALVPSLGLALARSTHERSRFDFFPHRFEFTTGWRMRERRSVAYRDVLAVRLETHPNQARHGEGTLRLEIRGTHRGAAPVRIENVPNAAHAAQRIRALVAAHTSPAEGEVGRNDAGQGTLAGDAVA